MVTVGSILGGTFRFVGQNIGKVAIWSGIMSLLSLLSMAGMQPFYAARVASLQSEVPAAPNLGAFALVVLISLVAFIILWAAVFRAALFPEQSRFAYLRLGMDELRLLGTMLVLIVGGYILFLILGVVGLLLARIAGASFGVTAAVGLAILCLMVWLAVRFASAGPLTIVERKVIIGASWRLTRGAFWHLFLAYLAITLIIALAYLVFAVVQMGPVLGDMLHPLDPAASLRVAQWQAANYSLSGRSVIVALVYGILGGLMLALQAGVTAVATDQLLDRRGGHRLSEVFE